LEIKTGQAMPCLEKLPCFLRVGFDLAFKPSLRVGQNIFDEPVHSNKEKNQQANHGPIAFA